MAIHSKHLTVLYILLFLVLFHPSVSRWWVTYLAWRCIFFETSFIEFESIHDRLKKKSSLLQHVSMHYTEFCLVRRSERRSKTKDRAKFNIACTYDRYEENRREISASCSNRVAHALPTTFTVTSLASSYTALKSWTVTESLRVFSPLYNPSGWGHRMYHVCQHSSWNMTTYTSSTCSVTIPHLK
jgi:hypothetical protein